MIGRMVKLTQVAELLLEEFDQSRAYVTHLTAPLAAAGEAVACRAATSAAHRSVQIHLIPGTVSPPLLPGDCSGVTTNLTSVAAIRSGPQGVITSRPHHDKEAAMTARPSSDSGIQPVGEVTADNARDRLAEQLSAVAALGRDLAGDEDDWLPPFDDESGAAYAYVRRRGREKKEKQDALPGKVMAAIPAIAENMEKIVAKLPEVDSWTVQAGFPWGVSVAVTFKARHQGGP